MQRKYLFMSLCFLFLAACDQSTKNSQSSSQWSSHLESSSPFESTSSFPFLSNSSNREETPFLTSQEAQLLVMNAGSVDVNYAKTSTVTLLATGTDNGIPYTQTMNSQYTTYQNDITIGNGEVHHTVHETTGDVLYEDTFDEVNLIRNSYLIEAIVYQNHRFQDSTRQTNLFSGSDVNTMTENFKYAQEFVSCGAGSKAYEDFYYAYTIGATFTYDATLYSNRLLMNFYAEAENEQSNQKYVATFSYEFDSKEHGFLQKYVSEQAFYSLDAYEAATNKEELTPVDYSLETNEITSGTLEVFDGEFPININSSFVQKITLSAATTTIEVGETLAIRAVVEPESAVNKSLIFTSTNENVAVVTNDSTGTIKALKEGTCEIVATNIESGIEGRITITVVKPQIPDTGSDESKADLKAALDQSLYQVLSRATYCAGAGESSGVGVLIDDSKNLNSISLSTIELAKFSYNAKTRVASYVAEDIQTRLSRVIPLLDNNNALLSNYYGFVNNKYVYYQSIEGFEIHLATDNTIDFIDVVVRNNSFSPTVSLAQFATLTDENIIQELGECPINKWGTVHIYYESQGFVYPDE